MLWQSALESAIQVAIAIAGFSGIVAAVGRRGAGYWTDADQLLLRILLTSSGVALIFAFLPFLLLDWMDPSWAWRIGSALLAIWNTGIQVYRRRQAVRTLGMLPTSAPLLLVPIILIAASIANAVWLASASLYVACVLWGLVIGFLTFVQLLLRSWRETPGAPPPAPE